MQIRKIGPQPEDNFVIVPNAAVRDSRLSFRARGVLAYVKSHADGFHVNAELLSSATTEGRDAMRTALNELIAGGYARRVRYTDEQGRWRTRLNVYFYGDAPAFTGGPVMDEDFDDEPGPTPENPSSENPPLETRPSTSTLGSGFPPLEKGGVLEDQQKTPQNLTSAADDDLLRTEVALAPVVIDDDVSRVRDTRPLPLVYRRLLAERHAVVTPEQQAAWTTAWDSAEQIKGDVPFEPYDHLAIYLTGCGEGRHRASAQTWLRFYIEDRGKHIVALATDEQRRALAEETPQEREDRYNRRRLPVWTNNYCPGCGCEQGTEPHREGCAYAATDTEETQA